MLKSLTFLCPHCNEQFRALLDLATESPPRYCPHCGFDAEKEDEPMHESITMPHIGKPIRATVDNMHREMEAGAEFRAQMAQEQFGLDAADASMLKLGDMRDSLRQGDTSDVPVVNDITRTMESAPTGVFGFQGANGLGYSAPVSTGAYPNMGAKTQKVVRQAHVANTADPRHVGAKTSSLPALETVAPGYRQRVR